MSNVYLHPDAHPVGMQQKPISGNHLPLDGLHEPVQQSPPSQKQRVTLSLPTALIERLRNAVYWTGHRPLVGLVAEAIEDIVTQMEEVNGGVFPQRVSSLKSGRRQGTRSPVQSTTPLPPDCANPNR